MYENQTEEIIRERMLSKITNPVNKLQGSFTYDMISPVSSEKAKLYIELDRVLNLIFPDTSYGEYLEKNTKQFGIYRKHGTKATGTITFTGTDNTIVPENSVVQTPSGLRYIVKNEGKVIDGNLTVNIEAEEIGKQYNVPINSITQLPVAITGIISLTNEIIISCGSDIETDEELLNRFFVRVQNPSTSGNKNDYRKWALDVEGVGDCKVFPIWNGAGTVKVVLLDSNKQPVNSTLISNVTNYIESIRPIGATVTIISASALNINISVTITKSANYTSQQIHDNISSKITEYIKSIAYKSSYVSYAQIGSLILDSVGVLDYSNLLVNDGTSNISIEEEQVAVLGTVVVN